MFLTVLQMKEHHPRFRWYANNWLLVHISVMHLAATRRSLKKRDPDLKVLQEYENLTGKGIGKKRKIRESESESEVSLHLQFTLYTAIDPSPDCTSSEAVHAVYHIGSHAQARHLEAKAGAISGEYASLDCNIIPLTLHVL